MREILGDVELQYRKLLTFSPDLIAAHANNAEQYQQNSTGSVPFDLGGDDLCIASAIGFIKACLDIVESHESLLLGAKAILVARLALNALPKVVS